MLIPRSIRGRLTTIAVLVGALVFGTSSAITVATVPGSLRDRVDARVELAVRRTASDARMGKLPAKLETPARVQFVQVIAPDGRVVAAGRLGQQRLVTGFDPPEPERIYATDRKLTGLPPKIDPGGDYRVMAMSVRTPSGPVTVYGAASLADVNRALTWVYGLLFIGTPLVLLIIGLITWVVVGFALRPVERIRARLADITGADLSSRVPVPATGDEITRLAATTNSTLDRLERSAETQRRFVADASHELRSPITALRTQLDYATAYPEETDWYDTCVRAMAAADRLADIIDELLMLARLDAGAVAPRTTVDLCDLARDQADRRQDARVPVHLSPCGPAPVLGSPTQLDRVLTNLLDNAVRHAGTRVDLDVSLDGRDVVVTVTNDGDSIAAEDRERVFERFTRLEAGRSRDRRGSGLGLALSREIVNAHGGAITVADHEPGARFVVRLPLRAVSPSP
ncbi:sensor histidine kinase [Nonomuraea sp. SBT364]|uniref:sensor histidine kinase n=1 Tax=Nonomuraea sp. SBT364 TaxID=1580530 RepID=UPI0007C65DE0|nr:ATP-binding protein [Nonomuraea sp. SBT364]